MKSLHTCNSILDRNISEDGQDRSNRAFKFTEKDADVGADEGIFKMQIKPSSRPTAIVKPKRKRNFSADSNDKTGLKNNKKRKIEGKLKQKITKIALFDDDGNKADDQNEFSDEEDFKPQKSMKIKTTIFIDSQDDINCCKFCDKIFVSPDAYACHMNTEHKKPEKVKKSGAKEEVKCCNICGNIYITKDAYVTHMRTDHSEKKNGFEYFDRKLPNKVNDELVETLKKVKNKPMPKSRKKFLFSNAFEKSQEQCQQEQLPESTKFWHYKQIPIASGVNKNRKKSREIVCQDCDEVFATKESKNLHTCNSILDRGALVDGQERKKQRVEREFSIDHDVFFDKKKHDVMPGGKTVGAGKTVFLRIEFI